jgi:hypothetical protein
MQLDKEVMQSTVVRQECSWKKRKFKTLRKSDNFSLSHRMVSDESNLVTEEDNLSMSGK